MLFSVPAPYPFPLQPLSQLKLMCFIFCLLFCLFACVGICLFGQNVSVMGAGTTSMLFTTESQSSAQCLACSRCYFLMVE